MKKAGKSANAVTNVQIPLYSMTFTRVLNCTQTDLPNLPVHTTYYSSMYD